MSSFDSIKDMFLARNYTNIQGPTTNDAENYIFYYAQYNNKTNICINVIAICMNIEKGKIRSSIGKDILEKLCLDTAPDTTHYILVSDYFSFHANMYLDQLNTYYEKLNNNDFKFKKHQHVFTPKYTLLSDDDIEKVERKYGSKTKFNKMIAGKDAIARYFDFRVGDIVKVERYSVIGGQSISYRILIHANDVS